MDKKKIWVQKIFGKKIWLEKVKKKLFLPVKFVKIGSITAKIFPIWTNVARTNVASTNVTVTVGICFRCSQKLTFKVSSKSG